MNLGSLRITFGLTEHPNLYLRAIYFRSWNEQGSALITHAGLTVSFDSAKFMFPKVRNFLFAFVEGENLDVGNFELIAYATLPPRVILTFDRAPTSDPSFRWNSLEN